MNKELQPDRLKIGFLEGFSRIPGLVNPQTPPFKAEEAKLPRYGASALIFEDRIPPVVL